MAAISSVSLEFSKLPLIAVHPLLARRRGALSFALCLETIFRRLRHGETLEPHLIVGDHRLFGRGAGLEVEDGAGGRGRIDGRLQGLQTS